MTIKNMLLPVVILFLTAFVSCNQSRNRQVAEDSYTGSASCKECHERFYELWEPSFHGKAMMPVDARFVREENVPASEEFELEGKTYLITFEDTSMVMIEKSATDSKKYDIEWSLGGKNVFCFLTPLEKGKLQTIPLAYDMNRKTWFNYPESAVRHFVEDIEDEPLPWKDRMYTFNTGCYNCHVSQLSTNFDLATETYSTTWREAGINCETCHGPSGEHVRVCKKAGEGEVPEDLKIIITSVFTPEQHNSSCAPCHAKMQPITASYMPGELYFDHFDLTTLEDIDFYPDGRDLGENYTYTGWLMNDCAKASDMHCVTCHTSSGRDRFAANPNQACAACHRDKSDNPELHTLHQPDSEGSVCINCHMPKREFVGHFIRSDHSFSPPMPEATIKFGSPNACNQCHADKSPEWANEIVKKKENGNYQEETLYWAELIKEAREGEWERLDEMLKIINENRLNEVVVASFLRLLANCPDEKKWETVTNALKTNDYPLVRSAAASSLYGNSTETAKNALLTAANDKIRLVRVSSAISLAAFPGERFTADEAQLRERVTEEYMNSLVTRPDDWSSHYNKGLFHQTRGESQQALESYETSARLYPEAVMPLINSSVLYSYIGNQAKAEENLRKVLEIDPGNEAASLNLGLLLAEQNRLQEAEKALLTALEANPKQAVAAYNLSVISSQRSIDEALKYARIAVDARPEEPKYAYTLAYYLLQNNQKDEAVQTLKKLITEHPLYLNAVSFLGDVYMKDGKLQEAKKLYEQTLKTEGLSEGDKQALRQAINALQSGS